MPFPRASGILLHPTCFPGRFGIGDLGAEARHFIDFLVQSKQRLWQVLPLGPTGHGNSPYMCYSALAGNPFLISPELLQAEGWLEAPDLENVPEFPIDHVEFEPVIEFKSALFRRAFDRFQAMATDEQITTFKTFCEAKADWLDDYALFMALKQAFSGQPWHQWEPDIAQRQPAALDRWRQELSQEITFQKFLQFEFYAQWTQLKAYANQQGIRIIGDIPIYVAHDSADVWAFPENFCLDPETGEPALMAGVPPDYFSATGQLWGNPVYNWDYLQKTDFHWWIKRFQALLEYVDIIRVDHFRGFQAYYAIEQGEETAVNGTWIEAPGAELFQALERHLGSLPILAEDLGIITPEVEALRDQFEFPGMRVLHFAFGSGPDNSFLPFNYVRNCVVYTGTHDNDTTVGWFQKLGDWERNAVLQYLGCTGAEGIHWDMIRLALSSIANQAIIPLQDLMGLDSSGRMNFPGQPEGNWGWRYHPNALNLEPPDDWGSWICQQLRHLTEMYGRAREHHV